MTISAPAPAEFTAARDALRSFKPPADVELAETEAPTRLAPFAIAVRAGVSLRTDPAGEELAIGRLVLLGDPAGHDAWAGTVRLVTYIRTELEPELVTDPLLPEVAWRWLLDAAESHGIVLGEPSGTVTRVQSHRFGDLAGDPDDATGLDEPAGELEIRASWSPLSDPHAHIAAWVEVLRTAAGLPPVPPGVAVLSVARGR